MGMGGRPLASGAVSKETLPTKETFPTQNLYGTTICQPPGLLIAARRAWRDRSHSFGLLSGPVVAFSWGTSSWVVDPRASSPSLGGRGGTSLEQQIPRSEDGVTSLCQEPAQLREPRDAQAGETELVNKERRRRRRRYSLLDTTDDSRHTWQ